MNAANATEQVVLEKTGEVRNLSGRRVGTHDPTEDARELRALYRYVGDVARGRVPSSRAEVSQASADLRTLAQPQGDLAQTDAQTSGTTATYVAGSLETIADTVCPVEFVSKTMGAALYEDVASDLALPVMPQSAGVGSPPLLHPKLANSIYNVTADLALAVDVPMETMANADIDMVKLAIRRLVNAFKLNREIRVANLLTAAGTWPASNQTAAAVKWNGVTPTPLVDLFAALGKSIIAPTHLVFTEAAAQWFFSNQGVYQFVTAAQMANEQTRPMPQVVIGTLRKMVAGAASYVWGGATSANAMLVYADGSDSVSTARTFRFIGDAPDKKAAAESNGYLLRSFFRAKAGPMGARSLVLVTNEQDSELNGQLGGIITGVLA